MVFETCDALIVLNNILSESIGVFLDLHNCCPNLGDGAISGE